MKKYQRTDIFCNFFSHVFVDFSFSFLFFCSRARGVARVVASPDLARSGESASAERRSVSGSVLAHLPDVAVFGVQHESGGARQSLSDRHRRVPQRGDTLLVRHFGRTTARQLRES